jgi:hypothetical protein
MRPGWWREEGEPVRSSAPETTHTLGENLSLELTKVCTVQLPEVFEHLGTGLRGICFVGAVSGLSPATGGQVVGERGDDVLGEELSLELTKVCTVHCVQPPEVFEHLDTGLRDLHVGAVSGLSAENWRSGIGGQGS